MALLSHFPADSTTTLYTGSQARLFFLGTLENKLNVLTHWKWLSYQAHPVIVLGVCVSMCLYVCMQMYGYMWDVHVDARSQPQESLFKCHSLCSWEKVTLTWSLISRLGWLASKHQESTYTWLAIIEASVLPCSAFVWTLESELMSSWLHTSIWWANLFL